MQPNYKNTCNTAKTCTKYSQNICSEVHIAFLEILSILMAFPPRNSCRTKIPQKMQVSGQSFKKCLLWKVSMRQSIMFSHAATPTVYKIQENSSIGNLMCPSQQFLSLGSLTTTFRVNKPIIYPNFWVALVVRSPITIDEKHLQSLPTSSEKSNLKRGNFYT